MTDIGLTRTADPTPRPTARRRLGRALSIVIALLIALADWAFCTGVLRLELIVDQGFGPSPVRPALVAAAPILSGLTGWGLLAVLERVLPQRGTRIWTIIAAVVCVLSCWSPITMALAPSTGIALVSMHLLVGAALIIGLRRR